MCPAPGPILTSPRPSLLRAEVPWQEPVHVFDRAASGLGTRFQVGGQPQSRVQAPQVQRLGQREHHRRQSAAPDRPATKSQIPHYWVFRFNPKDPSPHACMPPHSLQITPNHAHFHAYLVASISMVHTENFFIFFAATATIGSPHCRSGSDPPTLLTGRPIALIDSGAPFPVPFS